MPNKTNKTAPFATRLRSLRERAGLTRYRLAQQAGVDATHLGRLESGRQQPGWEMACRLADALGVEVGAFRE